jgi:hypothetical protein
MTSLIGVSGSAVSPVEQAINAHLGVCFKKARFPIKKACPIAT